MNIYYQEALVDLLSAYELCLDNSEEDTLDFEVIATSGEKPQLEDGEVLALQRKLNFSLVDFELMSNDIEELTNRSLCIAFRGEFTLCNDRNFSVSLVQSRL